jgi:hypothetical protein
MLLKTAVMDIIAVTLAAVFVNRVLVANAPLTSVIVTAVNKHQTDSARNQRSHVGKLLQFSNTRLTLKHTNPPSFKTVHQHMDALMTLLDSIR